ncbi:lipopolysaccharide biosynthesis protein [Baekduia sp. Peel2402]|uniref:lipopolysaccharide biosynthesis protein n=1 Tax=Baekduia sp. Peel2402 TaxID=3458296 RepID=UPI00403EE582
MAALIRRLLASTFAYQAPSILSALLAIVTLRLYTGHLSTADYGYAENLLTAIIFTSILLRFGIGEAFVRFWFDDEDHARRIGLARTATAWTLYASTAITALGLVFAAPLSRLILAHEDATLMSIGLFGLWVFTNLEMANALLRVEERLKVYVIAAISNILLTVALTVGLVVISDEGARGYVLGNYGASAVILVALWVLHRDRVSFRPPRGTRVLLRFGGPTVPADAAAFALNVVDRTYLLHAQSADAAGRYGFAAKLSTVVIVAVRGFQAAWPPLAYSVTDEAQAARLYARVTTAYVAVTGTVVCGVLLVGRWAVKALADDPSYYGASEALPWVALGWALYGLVLVLVTVAGRAKVTTRNFPATAAGLVVNVILLVALVGPLGIAGAGIALCGAYVVIVTVLHVLTRRLFVVPFEWGRLTRAILVLATLGLAGEFLLPTHGATGLITRFAVLCLAPPALLAVRVITPKDLKAVLPGNR